MGCIASKGEALGTTHSAASANGPDHSTYNVIDSMIHRKYDISMEMDD